MEGRRRNLVWAGLGLVFLASGYLVAVLGIWLSYDDKIMPGVSIAGVNYAGQSDEEVLADLDSRTGEYLGTNKYEVVYDLEATLQNAKRAFRSPFELGQRRDMALRFEFDEALFYKDLSAKQEETAEEVLNPVIVKGPEGLAVREGSNGRRVLYGENVAALRQNLGQLRRGNAIFPTPITPVYISAELRKSLARSEEMSSRGLVLTYGEQEFRVPEEEVAGWVGTRTEAVPSVTRLSGVWARALVGDETSDVYNDQRIEIYLAELAKRIDREPINATLKMEDGRAAIFSLSRSGLLLNVTRSSLAITTALGTGKGEAFLVVDEVEPEITQNSLAGLGIVELVAEGRSNFAGSPSNRRHNIRVGANKFDGVIIKPGETFSFTKTLGPVDASTGYLPELVIKANGTVPEYGGGLCQVSSTAFRAALNAGLPIVARKAHAYPVTYYKPYGTDATIYIPNPDLKFMNDTGHHILIQTRIAGNYLYFDFYGTKKTTSVKFAGNKNATGAVARIEDVRPYIYDSGARGEGSFTAVFWQFMYDSSGKLIKTDDFVSKYDSPLKYPH